MPEFTTISMNEAQLRTMPGRQGKYVSEYADYLLQLPHGQAGKLTIDESEKHTTIRRHLTIAANALDIHIIIKRSGNELYFWREDGAVEEPLRRRGRRRRAGRPDDLIPPDLLINETEAGVQERTQEETTAPDQPVDELGMVEQGIPVEDSPELGQT